LKKKQIDNFIKDVGTKQYIIYEYTESKICRNNNLKNVGLQTIGTGKGFGQYFLINYDVLGIKRAPNCVYCEYNSV
jgi:hypothetical protein